MAEATRLGANLRYPITIKKLLKNRGVAIKDQEPAMQYSFKWMKEVGDQVTGDTWQEEQVTIVDWDCPIAGVIKDWRIKPGQVIESDRDCIVIEEACRHPIQFEGLCGVCGKDMTEVNFAKDQLDTDRAPINMIHDQTGLKVSRGEAIKAEQELQRRLLSQRKLSLVVDLDQTIIHACIDPTVGDWKRDPTNPNHDAVKDVESFQLHDDGPRGVATGCWYYIKMRPGLREFLEKVSQIYELHVYTMGTRAYAENIAKIVDPDQKLFGNRIISRDENGSMTAKSLQRLFPVSTNMVIIIDDRADVWPKNRPNLIKVVPYDFFKGVGDINSSFLPKQEDHLAPAPIKNGQAKLALTNGANDKAKKTGVPGNSKGDSPELRKLQIEAQERDLEKQLTERPLLHMQEQLDKEDQEAERKSAEVEMADGENATPTHQRHQVLRDDDKELEYLEQHLSTLHSEYYSKYDRNPNSTEIPDVGEILDDLKSKVLMGTTIVLSSIVPRWTDPLQSEIGMQILRFGARLERHISPRVTHLVVANGRPRTDKVQAAAKIPSIKIVWQGWLQDSMSQWEELDEVPYLIKIDPRDRETRPPLEASALPAIKPTTEAGTEMATGQEVLKNGNVEDEFDSEPEDEEEINGPRSPIDELKTFNWGEADEDLDEFLGSDADDSESESENEIVDSSQISTKSDDTESEKDKEDEQTNGQSLNGLNTTPTGSKRKHDASESDTAEAKSALAKKLRISRTRGVSSLRDVRTPEIVLHEADNGLPTPQVTNDEDENDEVDLLQPSQESVRDTESAAGDDLDVDDLMAELDAKEDVAEAEKG